LARFPPDSITFQGCRLHPALPRSFQPELILATHSQFIEHRPYCQGGFPNQPPLLRRSWMNVFSKKTIAGGFAAVILSGSIAASTVPAAADDGSTIAAGILGATAGAMLGAAAVSAAPPPPPVVYAGPPRCWIERRPVLDPYGYVIGYRPAQVCQ
jgi:hypothetical protein